jgi:hypothetical protein
MGARFPAWHLANGVMNARDDELKGAVSSCETWAEWCTGAVAIGLVIEVLIAAAHPSFDSFMEIWGSVIADSLVALGVIGELLFSAKGSRCQTELRRRSDENVVEANARAEEARLKTEELRADFGWRALSAVQMAALTTELRKARGPVVISHPAGDIESSSYASQFVAAFRTAGWSVTIEAATYPLVEFGIRAPALADEAAHTSINLRAALTAADIQFANEPVPSWSGASVTSLGPIEGAIRMRPQRFSEGPAQIYVGPKVMPYGR